MARNVQLVVVCEDTLHSVFARAFLERRGVHRRAVTVLPAPAGQGDAKRHVYKRVPEELAKLRRHPGERRGLIYLIDADQLTVEERRRRLEQACTEAGVNPPRPGECVFGVIPKWEIENWIAYLRDGTADEDSSGYDKYTHHEREIRSYVHTLADKCAARDAALENPPPSLAETCERFHASGDWMTK